MSDEKEMEIVPFLNNFDELLTHLKGPHKCTNRELSEWLDEYTSYYPKMDFRDHLWNLHTTHHKEWKAIAHIHDVAKPLPEISEPILKETDNG